MHVSRSHSTKQQGFTIIELMVVVIIIAILSAAAFPTFNYVITSNRVSSGVNELIGAMNMARAESVRRSAKTGVCALADDGDSCGTDWANGYRIYAVQTESPYITATLRIGSLSTKETISLTSGAANIEFKPRGQGAEPVGITYVPEDEKYADMARCISILVTGAVTTSNGECS